MLKTAPGKYIMILMVLFAAVTCFCGTAYSEQESDELIVRPGYIFSNKGGRDPFYPRHIGQPLSAYTGVDISSLSLAGVTVTNGVQAALFVNKTGQSAGFVFVNGKMYGDNDQEIIGINGEIKSSSEVLLIQGDKEVMYTLNEPVNSLNIRPTDTVAGQ